MIIPKKFRKSFDYNFELRWTGYNKVMKVPYLSGCFLVFRIETLKDIGLFDERFFMYPEDIDISRRIAKKWDTIYYPFCTAVHLYGGASKRSLKMFKIHVINIVRYFNKWGWLFDNDRRIINNQILRDLEIKKINKHK